jgi:N-acetylneuraminate synthase
VTFDRRISGPDTTSSITFEELQLLCEARDAIHKMDDNPVDKDKMYQELVEMRQAFGRSVTTKNYEAAGTILTRNMLIPKKPGNGIAWSDLDKVLGRKLKNNVESTQLLTWDDLV